MSNSKINIIVLTTMYPNSVTYRSGIFVHEHVKKLNELGISLNIIAPIPLVIFPLNILSNKYKKYKKVPIKELIDGIQIYHPKFIALPGGFLKFLWPYIYFLFVKSTVKKHIQSSKMNILHVHGGLPDDYGAYLISKYYKLKLVLTVHGASVYQTVNNKLSFRKTRKVIENADFVIGVSEVIKNRVINFTNRKYKLDVIYNGFNFKKFNRIRTDNYIRIITVASLIERKGLTYAIESMNLLFKKFNNIEYRIIGNGPCEKDLKAKVSQYKLNDKIKFFDFLPHDKILKEMCNADIFILPSWDEAFGVVYIEAMSFKIPVIGTKNEGISDIIIDGENGFLAEAKNVNEITEKLEKLALDEKFRKSMGEKGYNSIIDLTWKKNAENYLKIYNSLL